MSIASGRKSASTALTPDGAQPPLFTIIGAGTAGVATGYYAQKAGLSYRILESSNRVGGNAATLAHGPFRYDTGAHRWHDQFPDITAEIQELLGEELRQIQVPSQIFSQGKFFDFPLSPLNLLRHLGPAALAKACTEVLRSQLPPKPNPGAGFRESAIRKYGYTLAHRFLLGYSEKLWGAPAEQLSPAVAGKRLKGLSLKTFLVEALRGKKAKTQHLDGAFYYPKRGIGNITETMADRLGKDTIGFHQKVTRIVHRQHRITQLEMADGQLLPVSELVSSMPLTTLLQALDPAPEKAVLDLAGGLQFRHLILVVLFLNRPSVTKNASVYFPDPNVPFTRLYEPRNRSSFMAPEGKSSVVLEIPTSLASPYWQKPREELIAEAARALVNLGLLAEGEVLEGKVHRVPFAYPVLLQESEEKVAELLMYLRKFENLHLVGRSASFRYTHLHDHFRQASQLVEIFTHRAKTSEQNRAQLG